MSKMVIEIEWLVLCQVEMKMWFDPDLKILVIWIIFFESDFKSFSPKMEEIVWTEVFFNKSVFGHNFFISKLLFAVLFLIGPKETAS